MHKNSWLGSEMKKMIKSSLSLSIRWSGASRFGLVGLAGGSPGSQIGKSPIAVDLPLANEAPPTYLPALRLLHDSRAGDCLHPVTPARDEPNCC